MKQLGVWIGISVTLLLANSCSKDEKARLTVNVALIAEGNAISKGQVLDHPQGFPYKVEEFKLYISNIRLTDSKGKVVPLQLEGRPGAKEGVFLFWLGKDMSFQGSVPPGEYRKLTFDLGLQPSLNDLDPNQFPRDHPLSRNTDMYWDMLKYRFLTFEGNADPKRNGSYDLFFSYHLGGDDFLREAEVNINLQAEEGKNASAQIGVNVNQLFSNEMGSIDITTFFSYHSQEEGKENGLKMMDFLKASIQ